MKRNFPTIFSYREFRKRKIDSAEIFNLLVKIDKVFLLKMRWLNFRSQEDCQRSLHGIKDGSAEYDQPALRKLLLAMAKLLALCEKEIADGKDDEAGYLAVMAAVAKDFILAFRHVEHQFKEEHPEQVARQIWKLWQQCQTLGATKGAARIRGAA